MNGSGHQPYHHKKFAVNEPFSIRSSLLGILVYSITLKCNLLLFPSLDQQQVIMIPLAHLQE